MRLPLSEAAARGEELVGEWRRVQDEAAEMANTLNRFPVTAPVSIVNTRLVSAASDIYYGALRLLSAKSEADTTEANALFVRAGETLKPVPALLPRL